MPAIVEVSTTTENAEQAQAIARALVDQKLAACVQISGPISSVYRWQGKICEGEEYKCTCKTSRPLVETLVKHLLKLHPYDVPEILINDVDGCSEEYRQWLESQLATE